MLLLSFDLFFKTCFSFLRTNNIWSWNFFMVLCCGSTWWTTAYQTCMRCLTLGWEATRCRAVGNPACTQVRGLGLDTMNPSRCTIRPAWSRLGLPASTTLAHMLGVLLSLRASFAAWISLSVISTLSLNISLRSNRTSHTCSGCRGGIRKVQAEFTDWWTVSVFACGLCVKTLFHVSFICLVYSC